ncbi:hypothetical protein UY3_07133 [Chelonia mydas]|uniref:Uncharacterized protein n=1 Tax=Chelonia mydas TaxID=8469 RepID=M7C5A7_CHEMY|nr:hypothetical protein UY3_07133 [Chelonia mydas]
MPWQQKTVCPNLFPVPFATLGRWPNPQGLQAEMLAVSGWCDGCHLSWFNLYMDPTLHTISLAPPVHPFSSGGAAPGQAGSSPQLMSLPPGTPAKRRCHTMTSMEPTQITAAVMSIVNISHIIMQYMQNQNLQKQMPYHDKHGAHSDHCGSHEHCKHLTHYHAVYAEPEPAKAGDHE